MLAVPWRFLTFDDMASSVDHVLRIIIVDATNLLQFARARAHAKQRKKGIIGGLETGLAPVCSSNMAYKCLQSPCSTSYAPALSSSHHLGSACLSIGRKDVAGRWRRLQKMSTGRGASCRHSLSVLAGIKLIENYDGKFELAKDSEDALKRLLDSPTFAKQVHPLQMQHAELALIGPLLQGNLC